MRSRAVAVMLMAAAGLQVHAAGLPRHGLVVFTNECVSEQSDDLHGTRVTLRRLGEVDDLLLERADFSLEVIWPVTLRDAGHRLTFASKAGGPTATTVEGRISRDGMTLELQGLPFTPPEHREVLKRVTDFSRPVRRC
jgi:hypothetical protein